MNKLNNQILESKNKIAKHKGYKNWDDFFDFVAAYGEIAPVSAYQIELAMQEVLEDVLKNYNSTRNAQAT